MASAYSASLKIELVGTGEQAGVWGATTNTNLGTALEEAITGMATATFSADADLTLTLADTNATQVARHLFLNVVSGVSLTNTRNLIVPTVEKQYLVKNATTGSQSIVVKTAAGSGIAVPNGLTAHIFTDGTNVVAAINYAPSLALGTALPVTSGGTGATSASAARTALGATTVGGNVFTAANPGAITFLRVNADNTVSLLSAADFRTAIGAGTGTGDVVGPASAVADNIASFNGTTGKLIKDSGKALPSGVLVGTSDTQTLTNKSLAAPTMTGAIFANGSQQGNITAVAALDIDCSAGNYFTKTINGASAFTFSNVPSSRAYSFTLELTHTSGAVTWPGTVQWPNGTAPTLTTGKTHLFVFVTDDGGTRWRGASSINYTN